MCDYSLHSVASRRARAGDRLVTSSFKTTFTHGFTAIGAPEVAVCLAPGTELAFDNDIRWDRSLLSFLRKRPASGRLVRFRQINTERRGVHHDAIEFPNGHIVLLTDLCEGQQATVVQLPVERRPAHAERTAESDSNVSVIDLVPARTGLTDRDEWFFRS